MTTHDTHMDTQQLMKTIKEQNQVIIAKDATIDNMREELKGVKDELYDIRFDRSWQKFHDRWVDESIRQKSVKIVGGFEYNTRYVPLHLCITLNIAIIAFGLLVMSTMGVLK